MKFEIVYPDTSDEENERIKEEMADKIIELIKSIDKEKAKKYNKNKK